MSCGWRKAVTVLVVVAVFYVFLSPVFVLDPSANRAWRASLALMLSIALIASLLFTLQKPPVVVDFISALFETRGDPDTILLSSVCRC
jgi:hypothetical protein